VKSGPLAFTVFIVFLAFVANLVSIILNGTLFSFARQDWSVLMGSIIASPAIYLILHLWSRSGRNDGGTNSN
jgi:hypothetical protein